MFKNQNSSFIIAIIFAAIAISGSLVFFALQISTQNSSANLSEAIEQGIQQYVTEQQDAVRKAQEDANKPKSVVGDFRDDDAAIGDPDAPVTMIEFSDFQCPFCRKFYNESFQQLKTEYIDTGKVFFVYRDFPLAFHDGATPAAKAAECARQQGGDAQYFKMHDKIFDGQNLLGQGTVDIPEQDLQKYARELGLNMNTFASCYDSDSIAQEIQKDIADGKRAGVQGTPGFVINNQLVEGAQPYEYFKNIIDAELTR
ncbi:disulfide bond formation protein DsbA [Candidatus Peregrinibacteria bacterium CG11_big_fil_rev_8_21_14_0_20_46_8]|nr:MAG: disulfide bond formation protein DsbA [Candidatus Peregrinibacteria bacterium CG11_big_fil_rev_8_21_14_0_20_46_8]